MLVFWVLLGCATFYRWYSAGNWHGAADAAIVFYLAAHTMRERIEKGSARQLAYDAFLILAVILIIFVGWAYRR